MMQRRVLGVLFFSVFSAMMGLGIIVPFLPKMATDLGATGLWLGLIFAGFATARAMVQPIVGELSDKIGRKVFLTSGFMLLAVTTLLYIVAQNIYLLVMTRFLNGVAAGMVVPVVLAYAGDIVEEGKEGRTMGLMNMMFYLGMGAGPVFGGLLGREFGARSIFYVMSGLCLIAYLVVLFFLPKITELKPRLKEKSVPLKVLFGYNIIRMLLVMMFVSAVRSTLLMAFLPLIGDEIQISVFQVGIVIAVAVFCCGLIQPPFGYLLDRMDKDVRLFFVLIGSIIGTVALFAIPFCPGFIALLIAASFIGIGGAVSIAPTMSVSVLIGAKVGMGSWMGILSTAISLGIITAPIIGGVVMDYAGVKTSFYVASIISLLGTFIGCYYFLKWFRIYRTRNAKAA